MSARYPERETVDDWDQGIPLATVREYAAYWADGYDWRKCEAALNAYPQFLIELDGVDIHFLHVRSRHENARPLLMTHGWPGSVLEFMEVIEPLTNPQDPADAFHLVIPSLPGFGFSGKPNTAGWDIPRIAKVWNDLMLALGYDRYFAQGGDWGSGVTLEIARQNLGACAAIHSNMVLAMPDPATLGDMSDLEKRAAARMQYYQAKESGYSAIQKTRPQTIGYALADSAVGQMAWILEKFRNWSDCDDAFSGFSRDALARYDHDVLADQLRRIVGAALLAQLLQHGLRSHRGTHGRQHFPQGAIPDIAPLGRKAVQQHHLLGRAGPGRAFCRAGGAGDFRG